MKAKTETSPQAGLATPADIEQAIKALTLEDSERIRQYAANRVQRVGRAANGRSHEDLMQEALFRLLDGRRHWDMGIGFAECFTGIIRSIASEWAGHRQRNKDLPEYARLETDLKQTDEEGRDVSPFDNLAESRLNPEQALIQAEVTAERETENKALVHEIETAFANDDKAGILILALQDGMDGPAIRAEFGISDQEFKTTIRRVRYGVMKITEKRNA